MTHIFYIFIFFGSAIAESFQESTTDHQWYIYFYTGNKLWAGTDSKIYVELLGDQGNSPIIKIQSTRFQLEANGVDVYPLGNLGGRKIGKLTKIIVGKQYSFSFFNDWYLKKAEVIDPDHNRYIFDCNCWLRKSSYKRLINLSRVESYSNSNYDEDNLDQKLYSIRGTAAFPATIGILFILLILILFTYFGNEICKKWKENTIYLTHGARNRSPRNTGSVTLSPRNDRNNSVYRNLDEQNFVSTPLNTNVLNSNLEDKPPQYNELFPAQNSTDDQNQNSQKNTSV